MIEVIGYVYAVWGGAFLLVLLLGFIVCNMRGGCGAN